MRLTPQTLHVYSFVFLSLSRCSSILLWLFIIPISPQFHYSSVSIQFYNKLQLNGCRMIARKSIVQAKYADAIDRYHAIPYRNVKE